MQKIANSEKEKPMWLGQYNDFNVMCRLVIDILRNGNPINFCDSNT